MSAEVYASIHALVLAENDPSRRSRLEQFIYALVCAWPHFSIHHAAQAALQLAQPLRIYDLDSFEAIAHQVTHIDLRSSMEWELYGYHPKESALAVLLSQDEEPVAYFLDSEVEQTTDSEGALPSFGERINQWRMRRGQAWATDPATYAGFHRAFDEDVATMMGNLKKIGALVTWEKHSTDAASWAELPHPPHAGDIPDTAIDGENAWYHFRIGAHLGRDAFAEIALCLGNVYCQHLPQVWRENSTIGLHADPRAILLESEGAGSIAVSRLGGPPRRGGSFFGDAIIDCDQPLPDAFRLPVVLYAAEQIQELLQGDTGNVVGAAWFADDPRF